MNFNTNAPPPVTDSVTPESQMAGYGFARGKSQFIWIAGLSLVNSLLTQFGANIRFPVGLGLTEFTDAVLLKGFEGASIARAAAIVFALLASGIAVLFGYLIGRGSRGVFIAAIVLYGLDTILCLVFQDWFAVAFHGWILFKLISDYKMTR